MTDLLSSLTATTHLKKLYDGFSFGPELKFGLRGDGVPEECPFVTVWASLSSRTPGASEYWRFRLPANSSLGQVRESMEDACGHRIEQPYLQDEAGFRFSRTDAQLPISTFSSKCQLRVDFSYSVFGDMLKEQKKGWSAKAPQQ